MPETLLIVGAGFGQIPALRKARDLGIRTVAVDKNPHASGRPFADLLVPVDVLDHAAVVEVARAHNVSGAMTLQSDVGVPAVGAVIDALSLTGNGLAVAQRCSDKVKTRLTLRAKGVSQPRFTIANDLNSALNATVIIGLPCVIKAPDSSGSRGVTKVDCMENVERAFKEAQNISRSGSVIVEEFIAGLEVGAQAFSVAGRCVVAMIHDDFLSQPPYMIPVGHSFPASLDPVVVSEVETAVKECVDALGIISGPSNIDLIIDESGTPKIIEVGARMGATCLPELTSYYSGVDWVEAAIFAALGREVEFGQVVGRPCAAFILEAPKDGTFKRYSVPAGRCMDNGLLEFEVTASSGDRVSVLRKGTDRIGKIIMGGQTADEAIDRARRFRDLLQFEIVAD